MNVFKCIQCRANAGARRNGLCVFCVGKAEENKKRRAEAKERHDRAREQHARQPKSVGKRKEAAV